MSEQQPRRHFVTILWFSPGLAKGYKARGLESKTNVVVYEPTQEFDDLQAKSALALHPGSLQRP